MTTEMGSMSAMHSMWMRMPGQTWLGAAASFLGMWSAMMAAMMLPSLAPVLWRYERGLGGTSLPRRAMLVVVVTSGYSAVWTVVGAAVFPLGATVVGAEMRYPGIARIAPTVQVTFIAIAAILHVSGWRARLTAYHATTAACCGAMTGEPNSAWGQGVSLGVACCRECATLMAMLGFVGMMNLWAMVTATALMTVERLPTRWHVNEA